MEAEAEEADGGGVFSATELEEMEEEEGEEKGAGAAEELEDWTGNGGAGIAGGGGMAAAGPLAASDLRRMGSVWLCTCCWRLASGRRMCKCSHEQKGV